MNDKIKRVNTMTRTDSHMEQYLRGLRAIALEGFDEEGDTAGRDIARIEISAKLLHLSEFRFFQVSYEASFGNDIPEEYLLCIFDDYIFSNKVPDWVREFAQYVMTCYYEGDSEAREFSLN
jgi:hypothetical protein